jgi:hypothetical protein
MYGLMHIIVHIAYIMIYNAHLVLRAAGRIVAGTTASCLSVGV